MVLKQDKKYDAKKKVPITVLMDVAKKDVETTINAIMVNNGIPADLMVYIVESALCDLMRMRNMQAAEQSMDIHEVEGDTEQKGE